MKSYKNFRYHFLFVILLCTIACLSSSDDPPTATTEAPPLEEDQSEAIQTATSRPTQTTIPTPSSTEEITSSDENIDQNVSLTPLPFFIEEFEGDLNSWSYYVKSGDIDKMGLYTENGYLVYDLQGESLWVYLLYDEYKYSSVQIETFAINKGKNSNAVSLICNYSDADGWYEFNISNDGLYDILVYSNLYNGYYLLADGGSTNINTGRGENIYTVICNQNKLALYINGQLERELVDNVYKLSEGQIGLSVSSFEQIPVRVDFDYIAILQP